MVRSSLLALGAALVWHSTSGGAAPPEAQPVSFRRDVMAVLSVAGCNSGACHGTPKGRNGFMLSLRGSDPAVDYLRLTRGVLGRRTDPVAPEKSLILQKALGLVPHEGGKRFASGSLQAHLLRGWIAEGLKDDPDSPPLVRIEVKPGNTVLNAPQSTQQLAVSAHFADGAVRDVTPLTVFSSSDESVATVSPRGLVEFQRSGEVAILCRYLLELKPVRFTYLVPRPGFAWPDTPEHNFVDRHAFAKLKLLKIQPSELCSDSAFLRRAYLDVCGILPTAKEAKAFLESKDEAKRAKLIDALLERPEFADFWTLKWMDVLRSDTGAIRTKGAKAYRDWMHSHVQKNTPFTQVVRELLTANGDTFQHGPANFYRIGRTPEDLVDMSAQVLFGIRIECARCHNHPFERWTQDDYYGLAAFFARVNRKAAPGKGNARNRAELISAQAKGEMIHLRTGKPAQPRFLGVSTSKVPQNKDRREALADWLAARDNPYFARSVANRIWYHLIGRGIVDPVDDFRDSNPPANDELLDALAADFSEHAFDVKHLIQTILNSRTYQLSARSNAFNRQDDRYFSRAAVKLLSAEQMLDAICAATEVPESYRGMPKGTRAVQLLGGQFEHPFLKAFGQPPRESSCECERDGDPSLARALQLVNGSTIIKKIVSSNNRIGRLLGQKQPSETTLNELYLATYSRLPSEEETKVALAHVKQSKDKRKAWEDILWALLNTREFLYRH